MLDALLMTNIHAHKIWDRNGMEIGAEGNGE